MCFNTADVLMASVLASPDKGVVFKCLLQSIEISAK